MTDPLPDPDEVTCPRCHMPPGKPCRKPSGDKSKTIHRERRREANPDDPTLRNVGHRLTPEQAKEAGKKGAQVSRRRRSELAAAKEAEKERLTREAIQSEAEKLARNLHAFETDRVILKRLVLDTTLSAWHTAKTAIENVRRVECDTDGRVQTVPIEKLDSHGNARILEVDDRRGAFEAKDAAALLTAAGSALERLRLEEGKSTSHTRLDTDGDPEVDALTNAELIQLLQAEETRP